MRKVAYLFCLIAVLYLVFHMVLFKMNEPYRNRMSNEDYINGRVSVTYYKIF